MLEVEPTGQQGRTATGSSRNGNEAVAGTASEAFARWQCKLGQPRYPTTDEWTADLQHWHCMLQSNCHRLNGISFRLRQRDTLLYLGHYK